jgi:uncharacterized protein (DUF1697 family)
MPRYAAFLRAVNVGGRFVRMAALRDALTAAGLLDVTSYIQSGNLVFATGLRSPAKVEALIEQVIRSEFGFEADTMVRTASELAGAVAAGGELADPFAHLEDGGRHMVSVLKAPPAPTAAAALQEWPEPGVRSIIVGRELHLYYAMPMLDSKLTGPKLARIIGCPGTVREWRVLMAVNELLNPAR